MTITPQDLFNALPQIRGAQIKPPHHVLSTKHSVVIPEATYSPWLEDDDFMGVYQAINEHTLVDVYRCFELWTLISQVTHLEGDILEVGVWRGGTGCLIGLRAKLLSSTKKVFLCDTFEGVIKASEKDSQYQGGEHADTSINIVEALSKSLELKDVEILKGAFPDETGSKLLDRAFSFCHIDVDVYESAKQILDWVWPRLSVGGIVVFDDYGFMTCEGITQLVNERFGQRDAISIYNLNGHAVIIKIVA